MTKTVKKSLRVKFKPSGTVISVNSGTTVKEAANMAGVNITNICGGTGVCGKCEVIISEGIVLMKPNEFINDEQFAQGRALACLSEILSDVIVEIPGESCVEETPKLDEDTAAGTESYSNVECSYPHNPLCRKESLTLPAPSLEDNLSDLDRIKRELGKDGGYPALNTEFKTIRPLAGILRDNDFKTTVTLSYKDNAFEMVRFEGVENSGINYGMAVDIGTTTIFANLINLADGKICGTSALYNSQMRFGEDVISRIVYTQENKHGLDTLQRLVSDDINDLKDTLVEQCGIDKADINYIFCTGNTVMIHILLGFELGNIRREPYIPVFGKPPAVRASDIGIDINPTGNINFLPGAGAYVGSDITADVLASGMASDEKISLLIDVGTNGEIVLGNSDWLICCSASAGPAFEGAGTTSGMRATSGAIEKVRITDDGTVELGIVGGEGTTPKGICGSGYIDLVAELFSAGYVDRTGRFSDKGHDSLSRSGDELVFVLVDRSETDLGKDIVISESDIATLIRTKGAIYTAAESVMTHVGLTWAEIDRVFIAGGFGNYLDLRKSIIIGLLPDIELEKFHFIGNGSIKGARMSLLSLDAYIMAKQIAQKMTYFDLSTDSKFMNEFTSSLFLPHTDLEKFGSATRARV
ncbi:ASKHA domain-containing protein [Candidatus Latescibacterota bacterium]